VYNLLFVLIDGACPFSFVCKQALCNVRRFQAIGQENLKER